MKLHIYISQFAAASLIAMAVAGSASASDRKTNNTILAAGLGAVAGALVTDATGNATAATIAPNDARFGNDPATKGETTMATEAIGKQLIGKRCLQP